MTRRCIHPYKYNPPGWPHKNIIPKDLCLLTPPILSHPHNRWDTVIDGEEQILHRQTSNLGAPASTIMFLGGFWLVLGGLEGTEARRTASWGPSCGFPTCSSLVYNWKHSSRVQLCCCRCCCCWFLTLSASFTTSSWMLPNRLVDKHVHQGGILGSPPPSHRRQKGLAQQMACLRGWNGRKRLTILSSCSPTRSQASCVAAPRTRRVWELYNAAREKILKSAGNLFLRWSPPFGPLPHMNLLP